jgi:Tfp pilus assembly protein PilW
MSAATMLRRLRSDEGLTLIELLVAMALMGLVISVIGAILISSLKVQQTVSGVSSSTTSAQAAASNLDEGIRNASGYVVSNPSSTDQLLVARVATSGSSLGWRCVAWYYSTSNGTKITAPSSTALAAWTLLTSQVTPRTGTSIFTDVDGISLKVAFDVTGAGKKIAMDFTTARPVGVTATTLAESDKCY